MNTQRFIKQIKLPSFGLQAQQKLKESKILIIGAGGLGVPVAQYLNAMGVGTLGLIDNDRVALSNLPRQTLYGPDQEGTKKLEVLYEKLHQQNPETHLTLHHTFLIRENALEITKQYDLIIDASDNFGTRYLVNDACVILNKPFIYGAVHQYEGHVSVFNYQQGPTYRCLFPDTKSRIPNCDDAGVLGVLPALIGTYQAIEAVKLITGIGRLLSGKLLIVDILEQSHHKISFNTIAQNKEIKELLPEYEELPCLSSSQNIDKETLQEWIRIKKPVEIIDVRSPEEFAGFHLDFSKNIPLQELEQNLEKINFNQPVITVCKTGKRSLKASLILQQVKPKAQIYNLVQGLS